MRYLKKVQVSALGGTGTIVDSLVSGSDPATNAPSIRAVNEKLGVNNLLFNGDFFDNLNQRPLTGMPALEGWNFPSAGGSFYMPGNGIALIPGTTPEFISPVVFPSWLMAYDGLVNMPLTLSVEIKNRLNNDEIEILSTTFNEKLEFMQSKNLFELAPGINLKVGLQSVTYDNYGIGYGLRFYATGIIPTTYNQILIRRVKLESGSTATPFNLSMRDAAIVSVIKSVNASIVAGLKVFEFSGTLPADTSGYVAIEGETGYNLSILAAYCYNVTDAQYYEMAKPDVVGASYYRPTLYAHGNLIRIQLDATSVTNYASQAYKIFALGWRA